MSEKIDTLYSNLSENNIVQKSLPLFSLWKSELTLNEFKILDIYLSRIDSRKPTERSVRFSKGELENLFGVSRIYPKILQKYLTHLMGNVVRLDDNKETNGYALITLFEEAICVPDENGVWQVDLSCTDKAMKYIFNVENIGYFRYKLSNIINLTSKYSLLMYMYIEKNRYRKKWSVSVNDLKEYLGCQNEVSYDEYKIFNRSILAKCHKEICDKTECTYTYTSIRTGRKITDIEFTVAPLVFSNKSAILEDIKTDVDDNEEDANVSDNILNQRIELFSSACDENYSPAQIKYLITLVNGVATNGSMAEKDLVRYNYLHQMYEKLCIETERTKIKNTYNYLVKMIKTDLELE